MSTLLTFDLEKASGDGPYKTVRDYLGQHFGFGGTAPSTMIDDYTGLDGEPVRKINLTNTTLYTDRTFSHGDVTGLKTTLQSQLGSQATIKRLVIQSGTLICAED